MWRMFTANNNTVYWDKIDKLVDDYNNTKHSSVKMTPKKASKKKMRKKVVVNLYGDLIYWKPKKQKFAIGDKVRISKYKRRVFDKGYTPNWTEEVFVVDKVIPTKPVTYEIIDSMGEEIEGSFTTKNFKKQNSKHLESRKFSDEITKRKRHW